MKRKYGTWVDPKTGIRHHISGVQNALARRYEWDSNVLCDGAYIDAEPCAPDKLVTCVRCWCRVLNPPQMKDILRGQRADQVHYDEVKFFDFSTVTLPAEPAKP